MIVPSLSWQKVDKVDKGTMVAYPSSQTRGLHVVALPDRTVCMPVGDGAMPAKKCHSFLEFSLCLSRACLGKLIGSSRKWLTEGGFRTSGVPSIIRSCRTGERAEVYDDRACCGVC